MSVHERTLAIIGGFYDAALDETLWPAALKNLTELTGSQAASFWVLGGSEKSRLPTFVCINFDRTSIQEYLNGMARLDPTVRYLVGHPQKTIVHDGLLTSEGDSESRAYYDWHERNVETRFRMVGQTRLAPAVQAGVALHRTRKSGKFEFKDIEMFAVLQRHLARSLAIGFRLGSLGAMKQFSTDWLDRNGSAVILLDEHKHVVFANRSAHALQLSSDGIKLSPHGIVLGRRKDNDELQSLIAQALSSVATAAISPGGIMRAFRPSGKRPYGIFVVPVSRQHTALSLFCPAVCIVISDPDCEQTLPADRLAAAFNLTGAEARLGALLAAGEELRVVANKLGITYGTARTRLAQIFQKTGTRRQGELIRLFLTTVASG
jgi:DNA-binding CsgD family transcriptional regulator